MLCRILTRFEGSSCIIQTRSENSKQYYIPKSLISYLLYDCLFFLFSFFLFFARCFRSFLIRQEKQSGKRSAACAVDRLNRFSLQNKITNCTISQYTMWYIYLRSLSSTFCSWIVKPKERKYSMGTGLTIHTTLTSVKET